jgi:hypothetical protein
MADVNKEERILQYIGTNNLKWARQVDRSQFSIEYYRTAVIEEQVPIVVRGMGQAFTADRERFSIAWMKQHMGQQLIEVRDVNNKSADNWSLQTFADYTSR